MHDHVPSLTYDNLEVSSSIFSFILSLFCIQAGRKKPKPFTRWKRSNGTGFIQLQHIEGTCVSLFSTRITGTFHREMGGGWKVRQSACI